MKLVSMKVDRDSKEEKAELAAPSDNPFPYGLCLDIDEDGMEKLGLDKPIAVGTVVTVQAKAVVVATRNNERIGGKDIGMSVQITDLGMEAGKKDSAKSLYPDMESESNNDD